jgi:acyl-coenzyme A thioesterase PaaI-like protein
MTTKTEMKESLKTKIFRWGMNLYPMYFGTGGKVLFISENWRYVRISLNLNIWTRNYVRTIFGGSLFSATDPFYMLMFYHNLAPEFVVWDKEANIKFRKPSRTKLSTEFRITEEELEEVKRLARENGSYIVTKTSEWKNSDNELVCVVERKIYVATKEHYKEKQEMKSGVSRKKD